MGPLSSSASGDKLALKGAGGNSALGSRPSQQDQYTILLPAQIPFKTEKTLLFLGVYDGHVTSDVSLHAKQHFHRLILESPDIQAGSYEKAIEGAVQKEDQLLLDQFRAGNEVFGKSGSTFSVCLVDLTDGVLVVGNLGDSHVLLGEHYPNGWEVQRITKAHKPGSDTEKERIKEAGGVVNRELGSPRIGALNMSRALGDLQYKAPLINADEPFSLEQEIAGFNPDKEQGDLLSNRPAISRIELKEDRKYIVILTTDGVTDEMEDRRILDQVVAHWNYGTRAEGVAVLTTNRKMPSVPDLIAESDLNDPKIQTAAPNCPVTSERPPAPSTATSIPNPGVARANAAISIDNPNGDADYIANYGDFTPLQQHVLFWDRDHDGQIYPLDTYKGFRELGFNMLFSLLAMLIINLNFSYPTRLVHSVIPDLWFRVDVGGIYRAKVGSFDLGRVEMGADERYAMQHGSDSGTYDPEGRFIPQHFEDVFAKYDRDHDGALTLGELFEMMQGNRCAMDPFGWGAAFFEWGTTWLLLQCDGRVYKEDLRGVYDGSIFWKIREERKKGGWKQGYGVGGDGFVGAVKMY
ncbi:hypothetical protein KXV92_003191 [Aspergillus fumigatus]|nr:hypothetical protein KXV92_003191 [Aspergillus fumigatus]